MMMMCSNGQFWLFQLLTCLPSLLQMCHLIKLPRKAQKAPAGFPKGWRFAFDDTITNKAFSASAANQQGMGGLLLLPPPPNSRTYYMVEKAKNHSKSKLADVDPGEFYRYVGLSPLQQQSGGVKPAKKRPQDTEEATEPQVVKKSRKDLAHEATVNNQVDMMRDLFVRRCKNCSMCIKPTCKNCSACKRNSTASGQRIVCYQKVCFRGLCVLLHCVLILILRLVWANVFVAVDVLSTIYRGKGAGCSWIA